MRLLRRTHLGSEADRATFRTLHTASLASPALRAGLTVASAETSIRHLRALLGTPAVALTDIGGLLAWDGAGAHHAAQAAGLGEDALAHGGTRVADRREVQCAEPGCPIRHAIVSPLVVEQRIVGTLQVFG